MSLSGKSSLSISYGTCLKNAYKAQTAISGIFLFSCHYQNSLPTLLYLVGVVVCLNIPGCLMNSLGNLQNAHYFCYILAADRKLRFAQKACVITLSPLLPDYGFTCCFYECKTWSFALKGTSYEGVWEQSEDKNFDCRRASYFLIFIWYYFCD